MANINENAIREAAYYIWQNAGCPSGKDEYFWSMAVEQLSSSAKAPCKSSAKRSCAKKEPSKTTAKKAVAKKASK